MWSVTLIGLLTVGLMTWMIIPSASSSLQKGVNAYGNSVATYIFVYDSNGFNSRVPDNVTSEIEAIHNVEAVYPVIDNLTTFLNSSLEMTLSNGTRVTMHGVLDRESAVIGGQSGFPEALMGISEGRLPKQGEAAYIINGASEMNSITNQTTPIGFSENPASETNQNNYVDPDSGLEYFRINATEVGVMTYNPMLQEISVFWNPIFLERTLGSSLYNQTFGGDGANYFIIKAQNLYDVTQIAKSLQSIFVNYQGYSVIYDQATLNAQKSLESGSGFLFNLIALTALFSVISIIFLATYIFSGKRSWESGLLVTQGWRWKRIAILFFCYYIYIGTTALLFSVPLSVLIGRYFAFSFQVYANTLVIPISINSYSLISSIVISLLVSTTAAFFAVWQMKNTGLDTLLRER